MSLRRQLLVASLFLLTLPWAGCQFIREMEGALRQGQEQALQATAIAVAAALRDKPELLYPNPQRLAEGVIEQQSETSGPAGAIYASPIEQSIIIDGYGDGWEEVDGRQLESNSALTINYRAATRQGRLYLFFQMQDADVVFHNPALTREPNGDRLVLRTWLDNRRQEYVIATSAPGSVTARYGNRIYKGGSARRIRGQWQDTERGYNLELEMPLSLTGGRLGFYIINAKGKTGRGFETLGNATPLDMAPPPWLIYGPESLQQSIGPFSEPGRQLLIVDRANWLLANAVTQSGLSDGGDTQVEPTSEQTFWLLKALYRSILARNDPQPSLAAIANGKLNGVEVDAALTGAVTSRWYRNIEYTDRTMISTAAPIMDGEDVIGAVIIRQSSEQYLSLTDQAFSHLLAYSLTALCAGLVGLLGYASILSWRIRTLSRAASRIVRDDGSLGDDFPRSKAADEIGELSRCYADLLDKLREYNEYLRTLSRKLSHELRTPIAVIQTSLENMENLGNQDESNGVYLARAREGLARLNRILTAMSEANRLEESIHNNDLREIDLIPLLQEVFAAYRGLYPQHELRLDCLEEEALINGVPDLLVQALDKLMDNAASFCPPHGQIVVALQRVGDALELSVTNDGPPLPEALQQRLFNSMVSLREGKAGGVHLGLGLYIVRLIADFHGASVCARNLPDNSGVNFTLSFAPAVRSGTRAA